MAQCGRRGAAQHGEARHDSAGRARRVTARLGEAGIGSAGRASPGTAKLAGLGTVRAREGVRTGPPGVGRHETDPGLARRAARGLTEPRSDDSLRRISKAFHAGWAEYDGYAGLEAVAAEVGFDRDQFQRVLGAVDEMEEAEARARAEDGE